MKCVQIRTRKNSVFGHISHSVKDENQGAFYIIDINAFMYFSFGDFKKMHKNSASQIGKMRIISASKVTCSYHLPKLVAAKTLLIRKIHEIFLRFNWQKCICRSCFQTVTAKEKQLDSSTPSSPKETVRCLFQKPFIFCLIVVKTVDRGWPIGLLPRKLDYGNLEKQRIFSLPAARIS